MIDLNHSDCAEFLDKLSDNSIEALITDPPAGIGFMGKEWDHHKGGRDEWVTWLTGIMKKCYRVMKPGAHGFVWAIPRTSHWTATALENAGFEVRDCVYQIFGSGFPKSLDVRKSSIKSGIGCSCDEPLEATTEADLSGVQSAVHTEKQSRVGKSEAMQPGVLRDLAIQKSCNPSAYGNDLHQRNVSGQRAGSPSEKISSNGKESCVEGGRDLQADQGQLHRPKVCQVPEGISADGTQGRLHHGASAINGEAHGPDAHAVGSGSPQGPQHPEQRDRKSGMVSRQWGAQTCGRCGRCGKAYFPEGIGTALKPAVECWWLIRKPISEKTVAANVLKWGCGGINVDAGRIEASDQAKLEKNWDRLQSQSQSLIATALSPKEQIHLGGYKATGRFPANLVLDEVAAEMLDAQSGVLKTGNGPTKRAGLGYQGGEGNESESPRPKNEGGASRFFYCAKTSKSERNAGLDGMEAKPSQEYGLKNSVDKRPGRAEGNRTNEARQNHHPTVKPQKLMSYLIKLITPPGGVVLDPFMGSGSTGCAAKREGFEFIGIEKEKEYFEIAAKRIEATPLK